PALEARIEIAGRELEGAVEVGARPLEVARRRGLPPQGRVGGAAPRPRESEHGVERDRAREVLEGEVRFALEAAQVAALARRLGTAEEGEDAGRPTRRLLERGRERARPGECLERRRELAPRLERPAAGEPGARVPGRELESARGEREGGLGVALEPGRGHEL